MASPTRKKKRRRDPKKLREYGKAYRERHPERTSENWKRSRVKRRWGITLEDLRKLKDQFLNCSICEIKFETGSDRTRWAHIDHCHDTRKIRGLLCVRCNRGLGLFRDDIGALEAAVKYLKNPPLRKLNLKKPERKKPAGEKDSG